MKPVLDLAQEVAVELVAYKAEVQIAPDIEIRNLTDTKVIVVPSARKREIATRGICVGEVSIDVGVIRKILFRNGQSQDLPKLLDMMEKIGKQLLGKNIGGLVCVKSVWNPLYDDDQLRTKSLFVGVMQFKFKDLANA